MITIAKHMKHDGATAEAGAKHGRPSMADIAQHAAPPPQDEPMNAPATFPRRPPTGWLYLARTLSTAHIYRLQAEPGAVPPPYRSECFAEDLAEFEPAPAQRGACASVGA
jgi:hypothetical protein